MADRILRWVLTGEDRSASKTLGHAADKAQHSSQMIGGAFSKLGGMIGGEFGAALDQIGTRFDEMGEHGMRFGAKLMLAGTAVTGLGGALTMMGAREKQSSDQLKQAIENTGNSMGDFSDRIEQTVGHMERFGYRASETKDALTTLTNATHDPARALDLMGEAADYAAVKHISLDDAATALARGINGSTRMFKQFGVTIKTNADGTKDYAGANERLAQILHGQASAAADNFGGKLRQIRAEVEDSVASFGQKYGPVITAMGPVMMAAGAATQFFQNRAQKAALAEAELAAATEAETAAAEENAAANEAAGAASGGRMRGALLEATAVAGTMVAAYAAGKAISNATEKNNSFAYEMDHARGAADSLRTALVNNTGSAEQVGQKWAEAQVQASGLSDKAAKAGITTDELTNAITHGGSAMHDLIAKWKESGKPADSTIMALMMMANQYGNVTGATKKHTDATEKDSTALKGVAFDANAASNAFQRLNNRFLNAEQSALSFKDAEQQVSDSVKQNGRSLDDNTVKGRANKEAVLQAIQAAQSHAEAVWKQTHSAEAATTAFDNDRAALKRHLIQIGLNKDEVQRLINTFAKIPPLKKTTIDTNADAARAKVLAYKRMIEGVPPKWVTDFVLNIQTGSNKTAAGSAGHHAGGTEFFSGGGTTIAEREPELVLDRGMQIIPLSKMGGGSSTQVIELHYHAPLYHGGTNQQLARALVGELEAFVATGGKLNISDGVR